MPIDFEEPTVKDVAFNFEDHFTATKSHAMQLEGQAVPDLVRRLGDIKSGRINLAQIEEYLNLHTLVWDRDLLRSMCTEADYKHEGSVSSPALVAALSGRFPKRKHTADWRRLAAILLGIPVLVLAEDTARVAERAGLSNDFWTVPPKALPAVTRRVRSTEATGEWKSLGTTLGGTMGPSGMLTTTTTTTIGPGGASTSGRDSPAGSFSAGAGGRSDAGGGSDALDALMSAHASAFGGPEALASVLLTTQGLKSTTPSPAEMAINASVAEMGRSTFAGLKEFNDFSQGLQLTPALGVDTAMLAAAMSGSGRDFTGRRDNGQIPSSLGATARSAKAWEAALPPAAIFMSPSALGSLRTSIRGTASTQAHFETRTRRLDTSASDMKKTLGAARENDIPLSRVEPVRDTHTLYNADYTTWGGANGTDRAAPGRWINDHPAGAGATSEPRKYPWG